jgi:hypothetical protein
MFQVYVCDGPIKMAHCPPKKKKKTREATPSNELKHEYTTIVQYMPYCVCLALAIYRRPKAMMKSFSTTISMRGVGWDPIFSFWGEGGDH